MHTDLQLHDHTCIIHTLHVRSSKSTGIPIPHVCHELIAHVSYTLMTLHVAITQKVHYIHGDRSCSLCCMCYVACVMLHVCDPATAVHGGRDVCAHHDVTAMSS